jgi:hypothetical protein
VTARSASLSWLCHKNSAFLALVNLRFRNWQHPSSAGRTESELCRAIRIRVGQMTVSKLPSGKLSTKIRQRDHNWDHREAGSPGPIQHPPTHGQTNRLYLQTRIRRPRTTTRFERGDRENAQTTRVRSEPHRTARIDSLLLFSLAPPNPLSHLGAPPQIKRRWPDKDSTSAIERLNAAEETL